MGLKRRKSSDNTDLPKLSQECIDMLKELEEAANATGKANDSKPVPDKMTFLNLLGGISACRKMPGIPEHMGYEGIYKCEDESNAEMVKESLKEMFKIEDMESLVSCLDSYNGDEQFRDFYSFWRELPVFDIESLNPNAKIVFTRFMDFASQLYPFTKSKGFLAWDTNEKVGLCRRAFACGIISEEEFMELLEDYFYKVSSFFDNWGEYAISCVCGAAYWMYTASSYNMEETEDFLKLNYSLAMELLKEDSAWGRYGWLHTSEKKYAFSASEMLHLIPDDFEGACGCFISDRVTVDGMKIGYMYREEPDENMPDSGWRFMAGDEDDEYISNYENVGIYHINTACNCDMDIIPFLTQEPYVAYIRDENGRFVKDE